MHLFLVRHGETEHNRQSLALGQEDVPLNETGLRQAEALGRALSGERLTVVYASPLVRASRTAEAIAKPYGLEVVIEDGLIEMDVGEMDGMPLADLREKFPGLIERWLGPEGSNERMPGGERLIDVRERAGAALSAIVERHEGERVCLVSHNFVILSLLTRLMGLELASYRRLRHSVAAITRVEWRHGAPTVVSLNDTCHLAGIT
ncbi:MAG: histidine phosphatase family protein [Chloroflexi bacterium]|nr:histidine phosphatase family protein [Chloroflexota bacterium]